MELFQELIGEANKAFRNADHLCFVTYPLVNDVKLIVTVVDNLNKALVLSVEALLQYEYLYKRISFIPKDFKEKMEIFKSSCIGRYNIKRESLILIGDIYNIVEHRKNSPVEFVRSGKFVMCTSDYKMRVLNFDKVKNYTTQVKEFILKVNEVLR